MALCLYLEEIFEDQVTGSFFFLTYFKLLFLFHTQVYSFWYLRTSQCSSQRFVLCLDDTNLVSQKDFHFSFSQIYMPSTYLL